MGTIDLIEKLWITYYSFITGLMTTKAAINFVGHSTIHIDMDGVRLITDPLLGNYVGHLRRQAPAPDQSLLDVDAVLISHLHGDHLDLPSLKSIGRETRIIVPKGGATFLKMRRFQHVEEIQSGDSIKIGGVKILATHAVHEGRRMPWSPFIQPLGYIIDGTSEIYFAGDTDLFPEMVDIGDDLEVALLPVWGWGPSLGKGHMDPERAAEALTHLKPKMAVPIHWGTYCPMILDWFKPRYLTAPPIEFARKAAEVAPNVLVQIVNPGDSFDVSDAAEVNPGGKELGE